MCSRNKSKAIPFSNISGGSNHQRMTHPNLSIAPSLSGSAVAKVQEGRHPQGREVSAEPLAAPCRAPSVRCSQLAQHQSPPCARPAHSLLCASFQPRLGLSARDWSRTPAKAGLHTHEGHEVGESRFRAARPALRLHFQHPSPPGQSGSRTARHSNWEARSCRPERWENRRRAQTRARTPKSLPARTLPPDRPRPAPWVSAGPPVALRAHPNLPPTAPPSWRRTAGALLPQGGPRTGGPARSDAWTERRPESPWEPRAGLEQVCARLQTRLWPIVIDSHPDHSRSNKARAAGSETNRALHPGTCSLFLVRCDVS